MHTLLVYQERLMFVGVIIFSLVNLLIKKRLDITDCSIDFVDLKI